VCRAQVFDSEFQLVRQLGDFMGDGGHGPRGIALDQSDNIYLTFFHSHTVRVYSSSGAFIGSLGTYGSGPGQFQFPVGICYDDEQSLLYIADHENHRVQIWLVS
jgi:DNA-binding beta-propeller fold protein YncE